MASHGVGPHPALDWERLLDLLWPHMEMGSSLLDWERLLDLLWPHMGMGPSGARLGETRGPSKTAWD